MKIIDCRGQQCPLPLITLKKGLREHPEEQEFLVLTDNSISCSNLIDYLRDQRYTVSQTEKEGYTALSFSTSSTRPLQSQPFPSSMFALEIEDKDKEESFPWLLQLSSEGMGQGDETLSKLLMQAYINALPETLQPPSTIICYNAAAKLLIKGRDTAASLLELEENHGTEILVCGACVQYYGLEGQLSCGRVTNMLEIANVLASAKQKIHP